MMSLTFDHLIALWGLCLVPLLAIVLTLDGQLRRRTLLRVVHPAQVQRIVRDNSFRRRRLKATLFVGAIALLLVALAGPRVPGAAHLVPRRGLDLVVALDFSRSMLATDVYPSRLERAKAELGKLIDGLRGDRVGMVAFAGVTLSYPLTNDNAATKLFWRHLVPGDIPMGGTDLALAIRDSLRLLEGGRQIAGRRDRRKPAQVIVLLSDGGDTEGGALGAAKEAASRGVKIYPVGIGSAKGDYVTLSPNGDGTTQQVVDTSGQPVRMTLDARLLRQLAATTGGDYFEIEPERFGVERVARAIADLQRVEEEARIVREPIHIGGWFVLAALLLLGLELSIGDRRRERSTSSRLPSTLLLLILLVPGMTGFHFERPSPITEEGNRLLREGRADAALAAYDRALLELPGDPTVQLNRGAALFALGRLEAAQQEFERASLAADPSLRADAFYDLGNTLLRRERPGEAVMAYKRALALRPDDRQAKWNLELALRRLREQERQRQPQATPHDVPPQPPLPTPSPSATAPSPTPPAQPSSLPSPQAQPPPSQPRETAARTPLPPAATPAQAASAEPGPAATKHASRELERQDAEAVLDAFETVELTVQKELARRRTGDRRARKDW